MPVLSAITEALEDALNVPLARHKGSWDAILTKRAKKVSLKVREKRNILFLFKKNAENALMEEQKKWHSDNKENSPKKPSLNYQQKLNLTAKQTHITIENSFPKRFQLKKHQNC